MEELQHGIIELLILEDFADCEVKTKENALSWIKENSFEFGDPVSIHETGNEISVIIYGNQEETYRVLISRFKHQPFLHVIKSRFDPEI